MTWTLACRLSELESGPLERMIGSVVLALFKTEDQVYAVDAMCAHQGGPLAQGSLDGKCLTCPWHGWQYDVSNGHNILTGRKMIETYPVEVREEEVWVEIN